MSWFYLAPLLFCATLSFSMPAFAQKSNKPERALEVIVQSANMRELQNNIEALGNLRAYESALITAKTTKTITKINFEDSQRVNKGEILVEMTNAEESALMEEARLTAEEAKKQLERNQSLAKTGAVSPSLLDQRKREYEAAYARFLALQARYKDLIITAPFAGMLGIGDLSIGSLVTPGQVITTLNDDARMKLDFTVPATYLRSLSVGLPVEARSYDVGEKIFKGKIASIDNQIDEATRSIKVRAIIDNPEYQLKQGLLMTVVIKANIRKSLVINESALVPMGSNNFVFVLQANKDTQISPWIAEKRQIYIGQRYKGFVEVVGGLREGEKVVTHGLQKIHPGQALKIMSEQANDPAKKSEPLSELLQQKSSEAN